MPASNRPWRWHTLAVLWLTLQINPGSYSLGGSLAALGLPPARALIVIGVMGCVVAFAVSLNSAAGVTYGVPFPVYARASYGLEGAKYAALSRGIVGLMWLSFQLWLSAVALAQCFDHAAPGFEDWAPIWSPYLSGTQLVMLLVMALLHVALIAAGVRNFSRLPYIVAPAGIALFALIAAWSVTPSWGGGDGIGEVLRESALEQRSGAAGALGEGVMAWVAGCNSVVSYWSTVMLNMADLARFTPTQLDQSLGQAVGIPVPNLVIVGVGIVGSAAVFAKTGEVSWLPMDVFATWPAWASIIAGLVIAVSTLAVNIAVNIIPPANDFLNLCPTRLRWRWCAFFTVFAAIAICPFFLFHTPGGFVVQFIGGYGVVTGAIYGVMVTDYFLVRRRRLDLEDLYPAAPGTGAFQYWRGHNWRAVLATLLGVALPLPSWLVHLMGTPETLPGFLKFCGQTSWFMSCAVATATYLLACAASPPPRSGHGQADALKSAACDEVERPCSEAA